MSNDTLKHDFEPVQAGLKNFPASPDQLIPLLQYVQSELGYLAPEAMGAIAEYLRLPLSHVYGVATFYAQFRFRPLGKHRLTVCRGTACHVRGSARLVEEIEKLLGIKAGDTTADMMFSLETVACLGSCALAPAVVINDKVHGKVTNKKLQKIIQELRGLPAHNDGSQPDPDVHDEGADVTVKTQPAAETAPAAAPGRSTPELERKDPPPAKPPIKDPPSRKKSPVKDPKGKKPLKTAAGSTRGKTSGRKTSGSTRPAGR